MWAGDEKLIWSSVNPVVLMKFSPGTLMHNVAYGHVNERTYLTVPHFKAMLGLDSFAKLHHSLLLT